MPAGVPTADTGGSELARASVYQVPHGVFHIRSPLNPMEGPHFTEQTAEALRLLVGSGEWLSRPWWDLLGDSGEEGGLRRRGP